MRRNNYFNAQKNGPADKPSRFVVDLKPKKEEPRKDNWENFLTRAKIAAEDFTESYLNKPKVSPQKDSFYRLGADEEFVKEPGVFERFGKWLEFKINGSGVKRLAIFSLAVFFYRVIRVAARLIFFVSYGTGWLIVFIVKFCFNLFLTFLFPILKICFSVAQFLPRLFLGTLKISSRSAATLSCQFKQKFNDRRDLKKTWSGLARKPNRLYSLKEISRRLLPTPNRTAYKSALGFLALIFVLVMPFKAYSYYKSLKLPDAKGEVLGASMNGVSNITSAGQALGDFNFNGASQNFIKASESFLEAEKKVSEINGALLTLAGLVGGEDLKLASEAKNILRAGQIGSRLGSELAQAMNILFSLAENNDEVGMFSEGQEPGNSGAQNKNAPTVGDFILNDQSIAAATFEEKTTQTSKTMADILNGFNPKIRSAKATSDELNHTLAAINPKNVPAGQRDRFMAIKKTGQDMALMLNDLNALSELLAKLLGAEEKKRYLLVFENNAEMRGGGGFIGSFALLDMNKGKIACLEVPGGGGYDTKGALTKMVAAPEALRLIGARWFFWDANWWPDWPTSARKLAWFYENSDGSSVDGVIGLTPAVIEKFLEVTGPINLTEEYGLTINAENFWIETQKVTESDTERETGTPKKIIGDMMKKIIDELPKKINKDNFVMLAGALEESLNQKHLLVYLTDAGLQSRMEKFGWDGKMSQAAGDYLMVANTNLAGGKTDKVIRQNIIHKAEIASDGTVTDILRIIRTHEGIKNELFTGVRNVNWMRIYVPSGAELIEAYGFDAPDEALFKAPYTDLDVDPDLAEGEGRAVIHSQSGTKIYNELGKTVFANWTQTDPGQTSDIILKYRLPMKLFAEKEKNTFSQALKQFFNPYQSAINTYSLTAQKQPGSDKTTLESYLEIQKNMNIVWHYPENLGIMKNGWQKSAEFSEDLFSGALIEITH